MANNNRYLIIIPAFNEEENIGEVLGKIKQEIDQLPFDILVIDDGSTDRTAEVVLKENVPIIKLLTNLGNGGAVQTGFRFAVKRKYDYVVLFDADGQHEPKYIKTLIDYAEKTRCDVVIGSRYLDNGYKKFPSFREIGVKFFSWLTSRLLKIKITDCTSGFRILSYRAYSFLAQGNNYPQQYPDADLLIRLGKKGFSIKEYQVLMYQRSRGISMHRGIVKPLTYVLKMLISIFCVLTE